MKKSIVYKIKKPALCFYCDYVIRDKRCYAIFETMDNRVHTQFVCRTKKNNSDWKTFNIKETKQYLKINLNE